MTLFTLGNSSDPFLLMGYLYETVGAALADLSALLLLSLVRPPSPQI